MLRVAAQGLAAADPLSSNVRRRKPQILALLLHPHQANDILVSTHPSESWFWSYCDAVEKKHPEARSELELDILEFQDFRNRAGGEGCVAYFIDSYDIQPSRVARLLTNFAPPEIGAIARDMSLRYPDDMPKDLSEREAYILRRFTDGAGLRLQFEWQGEEDEAYERLDEFCVGEGALELYRKLRERLE